MKYWITTDTHFGHDILQEYSHRPEGVEGRIFRNLSVMRSGDVLIHLGDICIGNDLMWHQELMDHLYGIKRWLAVGNHDKKTDTWYLKQGWDFVGESVLINRFGMDILFSHKPMEDLGYFDLNIHGHFHNSIPERRKVEM